MNDLDIARECAGKMYAADRASQQLGMRMSIPEPGVAEVVMTVTQDMVNGFDICHGGVVFSLADSAFAFACNHRNEQTVAAAANIEFLRPARRGDTLTARAEERHHGRRSGVYDVAVRNQHDQLVATFRGRSASLGQPILNLK